MVTRYTGGNIHNFKTALKVLLVGILLGTAAAVSTPFANQERVVRRLNKKKEHVSILLPDHTYGMVQKPAHSAAAEFGKTQGAPSLLQDQGMLDEFTVVHAEWIERSRIAREKDYNIPHHFSSQGKPAKPTDPELFNERLERYLPLKEYLNAQDVRGAEEKILQFNIPRPIVIQLKESEYVPLYYSRWMAMHKGLCPNCTMQHSKLPDNRYDSDATKSNARPTSAKADVFWDLYCPNKPIGRQHPNQVVISDCGEAKDPSGRLWKKNEENDYDTSYVDYGGPFHRTFSHLHFSPPFQGYINCTMPSHSVEQLLHMPKPGQHSEKSLLMFMHRNCGGESGRGALVGKLIQENLPIDRFGRCFNNRKLSDYENLSERDWPYHDHEGMTDSIKTHMAAHYKFSFALENTRTTDYFTEKRYQVLQAGSVPVVFANDNSKEYLPHPDAAIFPELLNVSTTNEMGVNFLPPKQIAQYITWLSKNPMEYQKYFKWKEQGASRQFVQKMFKSTDYMACRICEHASQLLPDLMR